MAELGPSTRVREVTVPRMLLRRQKRLADGLSHSTVNAEARAMRTCLRWCVSAGRIPVNPLANLRPLPETEDTKVKCRRALSDEEIGKLLVAAEQDDAERATRFAAEKTIASGVLGKRYACKSRMVPIPQTPFWKVLVATGLRYGEAASLRWCDVDDEAGVITVRAAVAKSRKTRQVPAPAYLIDNFRALRQMHAFALGKMPAATDRVFLSPRQKALDPHGNPARALLERTLERAHIPFRDDAGGVTVDIHALRRTAGTRLARHDVPLSEVSAILGHGDVRLTQKYYVDLCVDDTRRAIATVPAI
jgi:integrase